MSSTATPRRGEVWWAVLDPVEGTEMGGHIEGEPRPVLIVSDDHFNTGPLRKVIAVPLTTKDRGYASHVPLGLGPRKTFIVCEDVRSLSLRRFRDRTYPAPIPKPVMAEVEQRLIILLGLPVSLPGTAAR